MNPFRAVALLLLTAACGGAGDNARSAAASAGDAVVEAGDRARAVFTASPFWRSSGDPSREQLEGGRMDPSWRRAVRLDSLRGARRPNPERWEGLTPARVNSGTTFLPLGGDVSGPSVLRTQILLDRALFSPGIMDGRWGKNTEKAVYWLQKREGLSATGVVDSVTFVRLRELGGNPSTLIVRHRLTAEDVEGPFIELPDSIYEKAKLDCMCYESLSEKLSERFHITPELLQQLNPGVNLDAVAAGAALSVPAVRGPDASMPGRVARVLVSKGGFFVHALDAKGRILAHFPSTLGSDYDPSPRGDFKINSVTEDPWWHYQPSILANVPSDRPEATIPPGPNNAVGSVWIDLTAPHYGIHGTSAPETIGYVSSAGCVRLTNWDALFLGRGVRPGIPVKFSDTGSGTG